MLALSMHNNSELCYQGPQNLGGLGNKVHFWYPSCKILARHLPREFATP